MSTTNTKGAKKPLNELISKDLQAVAKQAASLIEKNHIPTFERAGNQKYVFKDSEKNPYSSMYSVTHEIGVDVFTDGELTTKRTTTGDGDTGDLFTVKDYNYIIFVQRNKDRVLQTVITRDYGFKLYLQHLMNQPLG